MDDFDAYMSNYQVAWRGSQSLPEGQGWQNRKQRPWILPRKHWEEGLWPGIRSGSAYPLPDYLRRNRVQKHQGVHNLKSSWMLCANLYFPFGESEAGRGLLAGFLQAHVSPEIRSVDAVELEYAEAEDSPLHPSRLLGEQGGSRGTGQTSPDVAFLVNGGRGLVLMENKFVEHSFYRCSARTREGSTERPGNPDLSRCNSALALVDGYKTLCHQVAWGRRYWEHLAPVTNREMASSLRCCPAARAGETSGDPPRLDSHGSGIDPERRMPLRPVTRLPNTRSRTTRARHTQPAQEIATRLLAFARDRPWDDKTWSLLAVGPMVPAPSTLAMMCSRAGQTQWPDRPRCHYAVTWQARPSLPWGQGGTVSLSSARRTHTCPRRLARLPAVPL